MAAEGLFIASEFLASGTTARSVNAALQHRSRYRVSVTGRVSRFLIADMRRPASYDLSLTRPGLLLLGRFLT